MKTSPEYTQAWGLCEMCVMAKSNHLQQVKTLLLTKTSMYFTHIHVRDGLKPWLKDLNHTNKDVFRICSERQNFFKELQTLGSGCLLMSSCFFLCFPAK